MREISRKVLPVVCALCLSASTAVAAQVPETETEKTLYAVGLVVAKQLSVFSPSPAELEMIKQGLDDSFNGKKPAVELTDYNNKVQDLAKSRRKVLAEKQALLGKEYLAKAATEKGAIKSDSGLVYLSLKEGSGTSPKASDTVKVHYRGTLPDGKEFDSSYKRGKPIDFKLDSVIKCWTEGVQKMKPGGKAKLVCPSTIAYGETGAGELILPGATLAFEIELIEVVKK